MKESKLIKFTPLQDFERRFDKPYNFVVGNVYELPERWVEKIKHYIKITKEGKQNVSSE